MQVNTSTSARVDEGSFAAQEPVDTISLKPLIKGVLTWVPGVQRLFYDKSAGGGSHSANYCYGLWLKHLTLLSHHGMQGIPGTVLELGPGASVGTGLAALLSGVKRYAAVDVVRHGSVSKTSLAVLPELIARFQARAKRPQSGWPNFDAYLDARLFPSHILTEQRLHETLAPHLLTMIRVAAGKLDSSAQHPLLAFRTWNEPQPFGEGQVDFIFSHAVLCHTEDIEHTYRHCARWLKPGGWMSHQTVFTSMNVTGKWNGHLQYSERMWKLVAGRRPYFISRERLSAHLALLRKYGFEVVVLHQRWRKDGIKRSQLAPRWQGISDEDLNCCAAFILARKLG
jgi:SAM-dependent methyltransferase